MFSNFVHTIHDNCKDLEKKKYLFLIEKQAESNESPFIHSSNQFSNYEKHLKEVFKNDKILNTLTKILKTETFSPISPVRSTIKTLEEISKRSSILYIKFHPPLKAIFNGDHRTSQLDITNEEEVSAHISTVLDFIGQDDLKEILKAWIVVIHKKKQSQYPYSGSNLPPWWPPNTKHTEPDHMKREDRIAVVLHLLLMDIRDERLNIKDKKGNPTYSFLGEEYFDFVSKLRRTLYFSRNKVNCPAIMALMDEVFYIAHYVNKYKLIQFYNDGKDFDDFNKFIEVTDLSKVKKSAGGVLKNKREYISKYLHQKYFDKGGYIHWCFFSSYEVRCQSLHQLIENKCKSLNRSENNNIVTLSTLLKSTPKSEQKFSLNSSVFDKSIIYQGCCDSNVFGNDIISKSQTNKQTMGNDIDNITQSTGNRDNEQIHNLNNYMNLNTFYSGAGLLSNSNLGPNLSSDLNLNISLEHSSSEYSENIDVNTSNFLPEDFYQILNNLNENNSSDDIETQSSTDPSYLNDRPETTNIVGSNKKRQNSQDMQNSLKKPRRG
ncbi:uncharacterized protein ASCRUDRAFT_84804 [Ascoidea rubescens DSM 1968]|uniref:Subtelomeric hrmA-associated cluster protein AFUB-079030/YDR124W-like helical bundle domain-containing protein n=1 Tax=Ascoidea rubescens DSM 1968 TaxID=1344418 RepID=A0A1D2VKM8_9ASCO|nr:hypothetical protein ASCRUDRAFT_84804 [Ascoidea rubescens DSM 1968]ODV62160.1 hypothetical protein ASCRUDRAFT_84804 [Ascoidea rubescens DSM 1968]